jgi:hypothetical protein
MKPITDQLTDLVDLDSDRFKLTEWEVDFVSSCDRQVRAGRQPTEKQRAVIDRLWDMVFIKGRRPQR